MTPLAKCPRCGELTDHNLAEIVSPFQINRHWRCWNDHEFATVEVPSTFTASSAFQQAALRVIAKRIARWDRDQEIKAQYRAGSSVAQLALQFNLTKTRIAQLLK